MERATTSLMTPSRRNFLKAMGTVTAVGLLNACTTNGGGASTTADGGGTGAGAGVSRRPRSGTSCS